MGPVYIVNIVLQCRYVCLYVKTESCISPYNYLLRFLLCSLKAKPMSFITY